MTRANASVIANAMLLVAVVNVTRATHTVTRVGIPFISNITGVVSRTTAGATKAGTARARRTERIAIATAGMSGVCLGLKRHILVKDVCLADANASICTFRCSAIEIVSVTALTNARCIDCIVGVIWIVALTIVTASVTTFFFVCAVIFIASAVLILLLVLLLLLLLVLLLLVLLVLLRGVTATAVVATFTRSTGSQDRRSTLVCLRRKGYATVCSVGVSARRNERCLSAGRCSTLLVLVWHGGSSIRNKLLLLMRLLLLILLVLVLLVLLLLLLLRGERRTS